MPQEGQPPLITAAGCQRVVRGLILLIGLVQFAGGIVVLVWANKTISPPLAWRDVTLSTLLAALFGSFGVGMLAAIALLLRRGEGTFPRVAPSDQPWLSRPDWAAGKIRAAGGATFAAPIVAAIALWYTIAILPLLSVLPTLIRTADSRWAWLAFLFPVVALALYAVGRFQYLRARRFGVSTFEMARVPGVVGGQLAGIVRIPAIVAAPDGFRFRLSRLELQPRSKDESHEVVIWQDERLVTTLLTPGSVGAEETNLPVLFAVPYEAHESVRASQQCDVRWLLDVSAELPGVDYHAQFEVPVFKTPESNPDFRLDELLAAEFAPPPDPTLPLRAGGIRRELLSEGVRLIFPAARNWRSAIFVTAFVIVFGGISVYLTPAAWSDLIQNFRVWDLMRFFAVGLLLPALTLAFAWIALDLWFYRSIVDASPGGLTVRGGLFGLGRTHNLAADEVKRFKSSEYMYSGRDIWRTLSVVPRQGKEIALAKGLHGKLLEASIREELEAALRSPADKKPRR